MDFTKNVKPVTTVLNSSKQSDIHKLAMELTSKLTQVDKRLVNLRAKTNKEVKPYMCVFSAFSETRNKGETTLIRNRKKKQRKREKYRKRFQKNN